MRQCVYNNINGIRLSIVYYSILLYYTDVFQIKIKTLWKPVSKRGYHLTTIGTNIHKGIILIHHGIGTIFTVSGYINHHNIISQYKYL